MDVIVTERLSKRYGPVTALEDLDVVVPTGVTGLVGANGAGKSTLIKILLGLLAPTAGGARVLGLDVAVDGAGIRSRVGYMPEGDCLPPDASATELVVHMARMSGLPRAAARERTADTLRHTGLYEARYRRIGGYSTGMRQRVKLACALVHDPALLLLDEPTNGLDPAGRDEMLALVRRVGTDFGVSVLVTSHLLGELEQISDHVVVVEGGHLLTSESTAEATRVDDVLTIELLDGGQGVEPLRQRLASVGVAGRLLPGSLLEVDLARDSSAADPVPDLVRDAVADLGLGLLRMQRRRRHLSDLFNERSVAHAAADPVRSAHAVG